MICYTSSGANLAVHFCGGKINSVAFSEHDANCGMENSLCNRSLSNHLHDLKNADTCCKNQLLKNKTKFETLIQKDILEFGSNGFALNLLLPQTIGSLFIPEPTDFAEISPHSQLSSRLTKRKVYLLCENFRI